MHTPSYRHAECRTAANLSLGGPESSPQTDSSKVCGLASVKPAPAEVSPRGVKPPRCARSGRDLGRSGRTGRGGDQ